MWGAIDSIIVLILAPIVVYFLDRRSEKRTRDERLKAEQDKEELNTRINKKDADTQDAVKALLRDRIIDKYHGFMEDGYVDVYNREGIDRMYVEYKNLGGNSVVDKLIEDLVNLPVISEEELLKKRREREQEKRR